MTNFHVKNKQVSIKQEDKEVKNLIKNNFSGHLIIVKLILEFLEQINGITKQEKAYISKDGYNIKTSQGD